MKKIIIYPYYTYLIFLFFNIAYLRGQDSFKPTIITGSIGKYPIEMEINSYSLSDGSFQGKYRYVGKKNYLDIKGWVHKDCWEIEEFYKGKSTGVFYLTVEKDVLLGWWSAGNKEPLKTKLEAPVGTMAKMPPPSLDAYSKNTNDKITGSYGVEAYYVNELHFPAVEVSFNGGYIIIKETDKESIMFKIDLVCGPTYHLAYAEGTAKKKGNIYIFKGDLAESGELCEITFSFNPKTKKLTAKGNDSMGCGFGARAYLDHELTKINDTPFFEEGTNLEKIKQKSKK